VQNTFVDYRWTGDLELDWRRPLSEKGAVYGTGWGALVGVSPEKAGRTERLCGALLETGVRLRGQTANFEVFAGYERRIDAYPVDRARVRWASVGFRIATGSWRRLPSL